MKQFISIFLFILSAQSAHSQYLLEAHAFWDDNISEWDIVADHQGEVETGDLDLTYGLSNDLSHWSFSILDYSGFIRQKFSNDPTWWEMNMRGDLITIRQVWPNDKTLWRISNDEYSIEIKTRFGQIADEWINVNPKQGDLLITTQYQGDGRDWIVEDYMIPEIPFELRLGALFIVLLISNT